MNPERWQRVQRLIEEALDRPEAERRSFVESACGEEIELRDEVLSLLAARGVDELPTTWLAALGGQNPDRFSPGERVADRYRIQHLLGRGGMGEVYEAWDEELEIVVALKTLLHAGREDEALQRLRLEGLLARSVWHPSVCRVYDLSRHGDGRDTIWFLIMERLHGATLRERLRRQNRLPPDRVMHLAEQMAAGLGAAHQAGVVHGDFKPGNVMLVDGDGGEQAVVMDFGTARAAARTGPDPRRGHATVIGTPAYMAPEQVRGEEIGPAADIYAFGVVLYEMATGTLPFAGCSSSETARRKLEEDPPPARSVLPELDERWDAVIQRCLAREPRRRFARAEDVADALAGRVPAADRAAELDWRARHTLPTERDSFVGRQEDLEALERNLCESRLVTLLGAGGMGKTRLALHQAWRGLGAWPGGVWFCDLTEARNANGIASAVATSLGIQIGRENPLDQLGQAIAGRGRCLLILDNFEQVAHHAGDTVGRWLNRAVETRCIVTSRRRLGVDGERVQAIGPLSTEAGAELFAIRARGLRPGFSIVGPEAEAAHEIVELADGMPLAIELAAARIRVMTAAQIAAQMRQPLRLLRGGRSDRHETLERAIDGSWELLSPWEQAVSAQCSVFEGGFTLQAAREVIDMGAWPEAPGILDVIQSLVDKSLLRTWVPSPRPGEALPEARFGMYVTLQDYARMKLSEMSAVPHGAGRISAARAAEERHGTWYARYGTDRAIEALDGHSGIMRRRDLELEIENVMAACRRALDRGDRLATATYRATVEVLTLRGPYGEAVQLGREVLTVPGLEPSEKAQVLRALGQVERLSGRIEDARLHWQAALDIAREARERHIEGLVLGSLGVLQVEQGRMEEARAHFEAALAIHRELGERRYAGIFTEYLGAVAMDQSRMDEARARLEAALAIHREVGDRRFEGLALGNLAILHREQGRLDEAGRHIEQALAIHREAGDRRSEGLLLGQLGNVQVDQGHMDEARACYEAALAIFREIGARRVEGSYLANLGHVHRQTGRADEARACLEAALAIHREVRDPRFEGIVLANLGDLLREEGRTEEARDALSRSEEILRRIDARNELGKLLCTRFALELRGKDTAAAGATLREAQAIGVQVGAGPDSELGRMLARAGQELAMCRNQDDIMRPFDRSA